MSISGYKIVWLQVSFDLPVKTEIQRRKASKFRNFLLDDGFEMAQYSLYMRFCRSGEAAEKHIRRISANAPDTGKVHVLSITDKQYEKIITIHAAHEKISREKPPNFSSY